MKTIKVNNSDKLILVDDEDFERLSKFKWYIQPRSLSVQRRDYTRIKFNVSIANEIYQQDKILFDHIDHNPLNNQKSNLRQSSWSQNAANRIKTKNCSSKYKGVYWNTQSKSWIAKIGIKGKRIHLGVFDDENCAAEAYNKKAKELFGDFAFINKISN